MPAAVAQTSKLIQKSKPPRHVFEATLSHQNVRVRVDALRRKGASFEIIEVKSAGSENPPYAGYLFRGNRFIK